MPPLTHGSSAYKLQPLEPPKRKNRQPALGTAKKVQKSSRAKRAKIVLSITTIFVLALVLCTRWVSIYGLHSDIVKQTAQLEKIKMENEQLSVEINTMTDSAKIESYAQNNLGMQKMDSSQIVYVNPTYGDSMQKVAKKGPNSSKRGIFGILSSAIGGK